MELIIAMENETAKTCFYFSLNVMGYFCMWNKLWKKFFLFGSINGGYGVNTGLLIYCFFYVLEKKHKKKLWG